MAKQVGAFKITGCYDNVCFYKMDDEYYARSKSSLTGKRVKKDPAFIKTMEYAGLLGQASKIASALYKELPKEKKEKGLYRKLVGKVMQLLKEGKTKEEILGPHPTSPDKPGQTLSQGEGFVKTPTKEVSLNIAKERIAFANEIIQQVFHRHSPENNIEMTMAPP